jgi:hypothetical protein
VAVRAAHLRGAAGLLERPAKVDAELMDFLRRESRC